MDVTTSSPRVAAAEAIDRAERYGTFDDVSVLIAGSRAIQGSTLREWAEKVLA